MKKKKTGRIQRIFNANFQFMHRILFFFVVDGVEGEFHLVRYILEFFLKNSNLLHE